MELVNEITANYSRNKKIWLFIFCCMNVLVGFKTLEEQEALDQSDTINEAWTNLSVVVTLAEGNFYRQIFPLWLERLNKRAGWKGKVYVGCVHCTEFGPSTSSLKYISMGEPRGHWRKFNATSFQNSSGIQSVGAFSGKNRSAKASKWALVLKVALLLQHTSSIPERIMFLDIDNFATEMLSSWNKFALNLIQHHDEQKCNSKRGADLVIPRGRLTLGESMNTGVFFTDSSRCAIQCLHAAVLETRAEVINSAPNVNDQEALYRMLNRKDGPRYRACKVSFIHTSMQRYVSSGKLPVSPDGLLWRSGTAHFTRSEKRISKCNGKIYTDDAEPEEEVGYDFAEDSETSDVGNTLKHASGRRSRGWWVSLLVHFGVLDDGFECTKPYARIARKMSKNITMPSPNSLTR